MSSMEWLLGQFPLLIVNFGYLVPGSAETMLIRLRTIHVFYVRATWAVSIIHSEFWSSRTRVSRNHVD